MHLEKKEPGANPHEDEAKMAQMNKIRLKILTRIFYVNEEDKIKLLKI